MADENRELFEGLLKHCPRCTPTRKALAELNKQLAGFIIIGTEPDPDHDADLNRKDVRTFGPWSLECTDCSGTGLKLSKKGMRLLGMMSAYHGIADPSWVKITEDEIEQDREIPF